MLRSSKTIPRQTLNSWQKDLVLVTGLSVGFDMFKRCPSATINTNVTGLSYIVSCNFEINSFAELYGHEIYILLKAPSGRNCKIFC